MAKMAREINHMNLRDRNTLKEDERFYELLVLQWSGEKTLEGSPPGQCCHFIFVKRSKIGSKRVVD